LKETLERIKAGKAALADQIQQRATIANTELSIGTAKNAINQSYRNLLIVLG
jgi:outer membrane protein TolC